MMMTSRAATKVGKCYICEACNRCAAPRLAATGDTISFTVSFMLSVGHSDMRMIVLSPAECKDLKEGSAIGALVLMSVLQCSLFFFLHTTQMLAFGMHAQPIASSTTGCCTSRALPTVATCKSPQHSLAKGRSSANPTRASFEQRIAAGHAARAAHNAAEGAPSNEGEHAKVPHHGSGEHGRDSQGRAEEQHKPSTLEFSVDEKLEKALQRALKIAKRKGSRVSSWLDGVYLYYDTKNGVYCEECGKDVKDVVVLGFDNSGEEYEPVSLCEHCIAKITRVVSKFRAIADQKLAMPEGESWPAKTGALSDEA
jgi:hypothetical protein